MRQFVTGEGYDRARQLGPSPENPSLPTNFFSLMRIEDFARYITFPIPAHRSFQYDFLLLTGGAMQRTYGLETCQLGPSMFTAYRSGDIVSIDACSADATGYYVLFDAEYVLATIKNPRALDELNFLQPDVSPVLPIDAATQADWLGQLARLEWASQADRPDRQTYIGTLLYSFLLDVQQQYGQQLLSRPLSSAGRLTERFRQLLVRHILARRSVSDYADLLAVTPNHLNKCVKEAVGKPASALIADMLVLEAKVLLHQTDLPISEIAFRLRFDDLSYFGRFFKKHTGLNPTDYRQKA